MNLIRVSFALVFLLLGVGLIYIGVGFYQDARELSATEPVPADELASEEGEVFIEGVVRPAENTSPLETRYRGEKAIAHEWDVEREEERQNPDSSATRTKWVRVDGGQGAIDFYVEDDSGRALVDTDAADVNLDTQTVRREGDRRYSEGALEPGEEAFVRGTVVTEEGETYLGASGEDDGVLIRDGDKEEAVFDKYAGAAVLIFVGLIFSTVALFILRRSYREE